MDVLLQELSIDTTKISRDVSGTMVSPIDVIAALLGQNPFNVKRKYGACCIGLAKTKLIGVRNSKEAGDAATIKRVLCASIDPRIKAICQKTWPAEIVPMDVAPESTEEPRGEEIESAHTFVSQPNQMVDFVLKLANGSDFVIPVRRDGYVNVTKICQAAGKRLDHWKELDTSKESIAYLQKMLDDDYAAKLKVDLPQIRGRSTTKFVLEATPGGNCPNRGTYAHPDLAIIIAAWASKSFQFQVSRWVRELRIKNAQLVTQIEELQAAAVDAPPAIAINGARKPLVLNGITIEVDPKTLMVNATQMCSTIPGKRWIDYSRSDATKTYLKVIETKVNIPTLDLITSNRGGNHSGTWVHRLVAYDLARWLSAEVSLQFTMWIDELMLTGRVDLGNEMSSQQLDDEWQQRVQEEQARHQQATETLEMRHRQATEALETRITIMERQEELAEQKTREELDAAIKTLARDTEQLPQFPDGANVLYAGYIGNLLIKYGQSSNLIRRLAEHRRHYPEFILIKALPCDNAVASEKKLRDFVAKKRIGGNYNNEKEIICFETQEDVYKLIGAMQRSCRNRSADNTVELKRIEADVEIKRIEAEVEVKRMEIDEKKIEMCGKRMELLMQNKITFEQYLQMK
jgi:hypothetical protein